MTIKIEFPSDDKKMALAFGKALCEIGGQPVNTITRTVGDMSITTQADQMRVYTGPGKSEIADVDRVVGEDIEHAEEHVHASHAQLAKDGASLVETTEDNVPPPVVEDPKPPVTDAVEQGESEQDPAVNAADTSDTDSNGLPWDERIHSANKSTNADGSWRNRRQPKDFTGEWKEYISEVESELKGGMQHFDNDVPPPVVDDVEPSAVFGSDVKAEEDVPPPPATDDYVEYANITFPALMSYISSNMAKGSADAVNRILEEMGIEKPEGTHSALPILKAKHEDRIPEVYAKLKKELEE